MPPAQLARTWERLTLRAHVSLDNLEETSACAALRACTTPECCETRALSAETAEARACQRVMCPRRLYNAGGAQQWLRAHASDAEATTPVQECTTRDLYCDSERQACRETCRVRHEGGGDWVQYRTKFRLEVPHEDFQRVVALGQPWRLSLRKVVAVLEEKLTQLAVASVGATFQDLVLLRFLNATYSFRSHPPGPPDTAAAAGEEACTSFMCGPRLHTAEQAQEWLRLFAHAYPDKAQRVHACVQEHQYCVPDIQGAQLSNWEVRVELQGVLLIPATLMETVVNPDQWFPELVRKHRSALNDAMRASAHWAQRARHDWVVRRYGDYRAHQVEMRTRLELFHSFDLLHQFVLQAWKWRYSNDDRATTNRGLIYLHRSTQQALHFCMRSYEMLRDLGRFLLEEHPTDTLHHRYVTLCLHVLKRAYNNQWKNLNNLLLIQENEIVVPCDAQSKARIRDQAIKDLPESSEEEIRSRVKDLAAHAQQHGRCVEGECETFETTQTTNGDRIPTLMPHEYIAELRRRIQLNSARASQNLATQQHGDLEIATQAMLHKEFPDVLLLLLAHLDMVMGGNVAPLEALQRSYQALCDLLRKYEYPEPERLGPPRRTGIEDILYNRDVLDKWVQIGDDAWWKRANISAGWENQEGLSIEDKRARCEELARRERAWYMEQCREHCDADAFARGKMEDCLAKQPLTPILTPEHGPVETSGTVRAVFHEAYDKANAY